MLPFAGLSLPKRALLELVHLELCEQGNVDAATALREAAPSSRVPPEEQNVAGAALEAYDGLVEVLSAAPFSVTALDAALARFPPSSPISPATTALLWQLALVNVLVAHSGPGSSASQSRPTVSRASLEAARALLQGRIYPLLSTPAVNASTSTSSAAAPNASSSAPADSQPSLLAVFEQSSTLLSLLDMALQSRMTAPQLESSIPLNLQRLFGQNHRADVLQRAKQEALSSATSSARRLGSSGSSDIDIDDVVGASSPKSKSLLPALLLLKREAEEAQEEGK